MESSIQFNCQARYFKSEEISPSTKGIWYVLHGYGQLARYFLRKFECLTAHHICVIAPEGLSNFYLEDLTTRNSSGHHRVGASWMTRENRNMDIHNYLMLLNAIHQKEAAHLNLPVTLLGFSQGCATVTRWALHGQVNFEKLILWAGVFPPDMNFDVGHRILSGKKVIGVRGDQDPYITLERLEEMKNLTDRLNISPEILRFSGQHEIHAPTLLKLL